MKKTTLFVIFLCLFGGMLFFLIHNEWLIIAWNFQQIPNITEQASYKKETALIFLWKNNEWTEEKTTLIHDGTQKGTIEALTNAWLTFAYEKHCIFKKISLETVCFDQSGTNAYLSFFEPFFEKEMTPYQRYLLIEGLLMTLRIHNITCEHVMFLVLHEPLLDRFLDFSLPWPLSGFLHLQR